MIEIKLLVTGGAGFIGSNFIRMILNKYPECEVVNLDKLTYAADLNNLKDVENNSQYKFVKGDICDKNLVVNLVKDIDTIINFAAETHVDKSIADATSFIMSDIFGTYTLLDAALNANIKKFIHIGTDEVYGNISEGSFSESDRLNPSNPYSASKASADMIAMSFFQTYGLPITIARSTNNFGPYQHPEKLIPKMITNAILDKGLPVYGSGNNVREWLFIEDNCSALHFLLDEGDAGEIYNISAGNEKTNIEVTRMILKFLGKGDGLIKFVKDRPGHDFRYSINSKKISDLGWKPMNTFEESLRKTVDWYRANDWWWKNKITSDINFH